MKKEKKSVLLRDCEKTLSAEFVVSIHEHLTKAFEDSDDPISPPGLRDRGLLESAVSRQHVGFGESQKYPSACLNAASLMYGLCNDHPFFNGNKRTALIAGIMHLDRNGLVLQEVTRDELFDLMLDIARHRFAVDRRSEAEFIEINPNPDKEVHEVSEWLKVRARKITRGERVIRYRELETIVNRFGSFVIKKDGSTVNIYRPKKGIFGGVALSRVYTYHNPGDGREVPTGIIKAVREHLNLTEPDGIDTVAFYDRQRGVDEFIQQHRAVLRLLARV